MHCCHDFLCEEGTCMKLEMLYIYTVSHKICNIYTQNQFLIQSYVTILTNSTMQNLSWETNSRSASQELRRILWNAWVDILSQMKTIHALSTDFPKIHFSIIYPFKPGSFQWLLSFRFSTQLFRISFSSLTCMLYIQPILFSLM